ncbi:MAG: glycosyltransferase family 2 protein, partial [Cyclobacteriaceae bacterium]|nr:glycosyltransferase family 2 protein [Cyclobacteriaceae bacterium HetDA_MAG_MS6]
MSNQPLVSIICLCYNHEKYVRQAVESALNQTYPLIEVIIIDDHSTDNSLQMIEKLQQSYPQLRVLSNEENMGNCKSFNKALKLAKGEFIIDLAAD